jgi:hypothetical protein
LLFETKIRSQEIFVWLLLEKIVSLFVTAANLSTAKLKFTVVKTFLLEVYKCNVIKSNNVTAEGRT